jgi:hypothetical protein
MRTLLTILELSIGAACAVTAAIYLAYGLAQPMA